jgi:hypothetical protein
MSHREDRGLLIGKKALDAAGKEDFVEAVKLFTVAIDLIPNDYRFFLNRSYCYFQLKEYQRSLADAESAIDLSTDYEIKNAKPFFRKAIALFRLKKYRSSKKAFEEVLAMDPYCEESKNKLEEVKAILKEQTVEIMNSGGDGTTAKNIPKEKVNGYSETSSNVSRKPSQGPTILYEQEHSVNGHSSKETNIKVNMNLVPKPKELGLRRPNKSPELRKNFAKKYRVVEEGKKAIPDLFPTSEPSNIHGFHGLFVSNVKLDAKKEYLENFFSKFGLVTGLSKIKNAQNDCTMIIVDYTNPEDPLNALCSLRSKLFKEGEMTQNILKPLELRLTANKTQKNTMTYTVEDGLMKTNDAEECFWFRGPLGCENRYDCPMRHLRANHQIDSFAIFAQQAASE